ncbi:AAA family ATPase [Dysosmobacter sp.]|uniref:AAA family ATPase n=1 Tax=Dysosmobacter sp. TaxID=2591382 RepID=UPI002A886504|nr:AAA family ATPase [Dysosmobacter sp.]MDY3281784.1 AAA family ATPase [Dysosmobacter sp.]
MEEQHIFIKLLGAPEIRLDGRAVKLPFRQAEAMVYYLAVSGSVSKERLCDLLWGGRYPEDKAKSSLRNAICVVRNRLGRDVLTEPTRQHLALNPDCGIQVDAAVYLRPGTELADGGEFLSGFHLKGSDVFDDWSASMAQTIRESYCARAKAAVEDAWGRGDTERCRQLCRELIAANEYDEFGYRYLMLCLSRKQDYVAALDVYQQLRRLLAEDLFQEPEEETEQTARDIRELRRATLSNLPLGRPLRERGAEFVYGREEELQAIPDALNGFFRGLPASSLLIRGEMGVGKSFLLEQVLRRADAAGGRVISVRCYSAETAVPLKVYYDILNQLLSGEEDASSTEQLRRAMSILLPQTARPANSLVGQETTGLIEALLSCCRRRRLLVAIDDLQWADSASLALIHNILTLDKNRTILFLLTCRSEPAAEADSLVRSLKLSGLLREHDLLPFTYDQTLAFAQTLLPDRPVDEAFARRLYRESDGNPLFLAECLNGIRFGGGMAGLSPRLTDIIRQRIDSLPPESARLLELISITPDGADFELLAAVSQQDDYALSETLEQLLDRQLLREDGAGGRVVFRFVHQKILEFTYDHISSIRRRLLHGKVAACLEARVPEDDAALYDYSRLIYHLERSGQLLKYLQYVLRNIVGYLNMSQEFFPLVQEARPPLVFREEERGVAVLELGSLEHYLNAVEQKIRDNPQVFRQPEAQGAVLEFYTLQAQHYVHQADYPKAFAYVETLRRLSTPQNTPEWRKYLLKANHFLAALYMDRNDIPRLRVTIRESRALLSQVEDPETRATWMRLQGVCEVIAGDYGEAYQRLSSAAELFLSFDNADVYAYSLGACQAWMGEALRLQGDPDSAETLYRQAIALCENSRASGGIAVFYTFYARCLLDRPEPRETHRAEAMLARGRELCGQFNLLWYRGVTYAYSALAACRRGEAEQAGRFLREARSAAARLESSYEQAVAEEIGQRVRQAFSAAPEQLRRFETALQGA